jgi:hypothetical protein
MTLSTALATLGLAFSNLPSITVNVPGVSSPRLTIVGSSPWCLFTSPNDVLCVENTEAACEVTAERLEASELAPNERCLHSDDVVEMVSK